MMVHKRDTSAETDSEHGAERKPGEDTAIRSLSKDEIKRLSIDAWEPSLLRRMLEARNKGERGR